ncbi:unnamed protein product [Rotaria sp. Silwood1]|nr:unnamed protein product [Rotaria sp. Silwood1]CAF1567267.1 unnamed protein product [Rotaria sp. Silwood1]
MTQRAIDLFLTIEKPDKIIFSILFNACAQLRTKDALDLGKKVFNQLPIECRQSNDLLYSVLNMFIKCDDLKSAESLFNRIDRDLISYGSMMKFYNMKEQPEQTLTLFEQMKQNKIKPNKIIFVLLIDACSVIGDLSLCQSLISQIPPSFLTDPWIQVGLVDMWGKVGSPDKAKKVFDMIEQPINAYGLNGMGFEAVQLFQKVPTNILDACIYVCVLNACSHAGLINEARQIFEMIPFNQRVEQIYTTMVDTFNRSYLFDEAQKFIDEFEKSHRPSIPMYMSMLSSARNEKNGSLVQTIFDRIESKFSDVESCLTSATVLLANTHALSGNKSLASNIRMKLDQSGMKKVVGISWTVVDGKVFKFRAHDRSHPFSTEIYAELDRLRIELMKYDYKPDDSWITRPLKNDETAESVLCGHSERLAIAFNLIQRPTPTRIQIVKNLRVCGDCR